MIGWLQHANLQGELPQYGEFPNLFQIFDEHGILRCLFKKFEDGDALAARKEAFVYLLDHLIYGHRSQSTEIYGFSGVLSIVFVRFTIGNENKMGVLVQFMENVSRIGEYFCKYHERINIGELLMIFVLDVRFGNMDRNRDNIDYHEMCFANDGQNYNICSPCWLGLVKNSANSQDCVNYVAQLDPDVDIVFLRRCEWEPNYIEQFTVFMTFLKKAVLQGITPYHIGLMASFKCDDLSFTLQAMVDSVERDEKFLVNVGNHIEERLREYHAAI